MKISLKRGIQGKGKTRQLHVIGATVLILLAGSSCSTMRSQPVAEGAREPASSKDSAVLTPKTPEQIEAAELAEGKTNAEAAKAHAEATAEYHFTLAQAYVAEGNPDRAIEEYKLTLMFDPTSALVETRLAAEYVKKGMLSAAMEACKEALQHDPKFTDARLMLAGLYSTAHETEKALQEYDAVLKVDPKNEEAVIYKAQVLVEDDRSDEAAKVLKAFVKRDPEAALAYYYLGRAEQIQDHFKSAVLAYRKSMELRSGFAQPALALGYLYEEKGMTQQAIATYQDVFDESQDLSAANRLATIYLKQEKYKEAAPYLDAVVAGDPDDLNARVKLGLIQMELKQYDKAIASFNSILAKSPESDRVLYYLGSLYEEIQKTDLAVATLKKIKPDSKLYGEAVLHVGYLLKEDKKIDDAKKYIAGAISQSPDIANFYIFQASLEEETKNIDKAVKILEAVESKFSDDEKILYYLGSLYDRQGKQEKGVEKMEALLKINPNNVDALNYIGYTWTTMGIRLDDAEKVLRKALALRPDNGYIQDSWGWYLFVRGRTSEAVVELEKASKLKPNESTILEHLGDAYLRANLEEKALAQYKNAAIYAEDDESRKKLESKADNLKQELAKEGKLPLDRIPATAGH